MRTTPKQPPSLSPVAPAGIAAENDMDEDTMNITLKTPAQQDKMRAAGRLAADLLDMIGQHIQPGVTTDDINQICHDYQVNIANCVPAPLGYRGFPKSICTSVNHVVCHGIPSDKHA
jgi:methionyl aminopeptidase